MNSFNAEIDKMTPEQWSEVVSSMSDASIYQTWNYGAVRWGDQNLSHVVLLKNNKICSAVQIRIIRIPLLNKGIAYITRGPMWNPKDSRPNFDYFKQMILALENEYVNNRKMCLYIKPNIFTNDDKEIFSFFNDRKFGFKQDNYQTIMLDLKDDINTIRKNFRQKWRNQLNRAEKNGLEIVEGTDDSLFDIFFKLYNEMLDRKGFVPGLDAMEFEHIQRELPSSQKMYSLVCYYNGKPISAQINSLIGDTVVYLLGATGDIGLTLKGAYLLQWKTIQWAKNSGARWYDLGGIDPVNNPGVYHFKKGFGGMEKMIIGRFDLSPDIISRLMVTGIDHSFKTRLQINKNIVKFIKKKAVSSVN